MASESYELENRILELCKSCNYKALIEIGPEVIEPLLKALYLHYTVTSRPTILGIIEDLYELATPEEKVRIFILLFQFLPDKGIPRLLEKLLNLAGGEEVKNHLPEIFDEISQRYSCQRRFPISKILEIIKKIGSQAADIIINYFDIPEKMSFAKAVFSSNIVEVNEDLLMEKLVHMRYSGTDEEREGIIKILERRHWKSVDNTNAANVFKYSHKNCRALELTEIRGGISRILDLVKEDPKRLELTRKQLRDFYEETIRLRKRRNVKVKIKLVGDLPKPRIRDVVFRSTEQRRLLTCRA